MLAIWAWIPMVALSLLPHKEPSYLVPILPFFAMLAAVTLWQAIVWLQRSTPPEHDKRRERVAIQLMAIVIAVLMTEPAAYVLARSDDGITIARYIATTRPTDGVVAEPAWNIGGRIYLPLANPLIDVDPSQMQDGSYVDGVIRSPGVGWLVLQDRDVTRFRYEPLIAAAGFDEVVVPAVVRFYRVYRRR
jgi:hypothetical protein